MAKLHEGLEQVKAAQIEKGAMIGIMEVSAVPDSVRLREPDTLLRLSGKH